LNNLDMQIDRFVDISFFIFLYKHTRVSRVCFFKKCNIISISTKHARHLYRKCLTPRRYIACAAASLIIILCDSFNEFFFFASFSPFFFSRHIVYYSKRHGGNIKHDQLLIPALSRDVWHLSFIYKKPPHTHTHNKRLFLVEKKGK
jgi:hypothetical protein